MAFLRAVNVGGRTITGATLRSLLGDLDLGRVSTFIASGNVIFEGAGGDPGRIERRVESALSAGLGYEVDTFVRSIEEIAGLVAEPVFTPADGVTIHVGFMRRAPSRKVAAALAALGDAGDRLVPEGRQLWWRRAGRTIDSPLATPVLGQTLGQPITMRNLRTLERLSAKYAPG